MSENKRKQSARQSLNKEEEQNEDRPDRTERKWWLGLCATQSPHPIPTSYISTQNALPHRRDEDMHRGYNKFRDRETHVFRRFPSLQRNKD